MWRRLNAADWTDQRRWNVDATFAVSSREFHLWCHILGSISTKWEQLPWHKKLKTKDWFTDLVTESNRKSCTSFYIKCQNQKSSWKTTFSHPVAASQSVLWLFLVVKYGIKHMSWCVDESSLLSVLQLLSCRCFLVPVDQLIPAFTLRLWGVFFGYPPQNHDCQEEAEQRAAHKHRHQTQEPAHTQTHTGFWEVCPTSIRILIKSWLSSHSTAELGVFDKYVTVTSKIAEQQVRLTSVWTCPGCSRDRKSSAHTSCPTWCRWYQWHSRTTPDQVRMLHTDLQLTDESS